MAFYASCRVLGKEMADRVFPERLKSLEGYLLRRPFWITVFIRSFPIGNNALTSLFSGLRGIPAQPFFLGSLVGYIPHSLIFSAMGSSARGNMDYLVWLIVLLYVFSYPHLLWWAARGRLASLFVNTSSVSQSD